MDVLLRPTALLKIVFFLSCFLSRKLWFCTPRLQSSTAIPVAAVATAVARLITSVAYATNTLPQGSFTKNTAAELDAMAAELGLWSSQATRPPLPSAEEAAALESEAAARKTKLTELDAKMDIKR